MNPTLVALVALLTTTFGGPRVPSQVDGRVPLALEAPARFEGTWSSTYGMMRLEQRGNEVTGTYAYSSGSQIHGTVEGRRLTFQYREPTAQGEGWFELAEDAQSFTGRWRAKGTDRWQRWTGTRPTPVAARGERKWLVVLEHRWETSVVEQEFTFGAMLRAFFARSKGILVRHRMVHDRADFERVCKELAFLDEPVYLVLASHGTPSGLSLSDGTLGGDAIAAALAPIDHLRLVHFSACSAMAGEIPAQILAARGPASRLEGVSGYEVSVDWAASALLEFLYLDLVFQRGMSPGAASRQVVRELPFAADTVTNSVLGPAKFRFQEATVKAPHPVAETDD